MSTNKENTRELAPEPVVTANGRLFPCPSLGEWFTLEAIDAHPRLSLFDEVVLVLPEDKVLEFASWHQFWCHLVRHRVKTVAISFSSDSTNTAH